MFDLKEKDDRGNYRIGMYMLRVPNDTKRGYSLIDVRDYAPAKFYVTQCLTIMNDRVRFRCGQCNKLIYVNDWNGAIRLGRHMIPLFVICVLRTFWGVLLMCLKCDKEVYHNKLCINHYWEYLLKQYYEQPLQGIELRGE